MDIKGLVESKYKNLLEGSDSIIIINNKGSILYCSNSAKAFFDSENIEKVNVLTLFEDATTLEEILAKGIYDIHIEAIIRLDGTPVTVFVTKFQRTGIPILDRFLSFTMLYLKTNTKKVNNLTKALNNIIVFTLGFSIIMGAIGLSTYVLIQVVDQISYNNKK